MRAFSGVILYTAMILFWTGCGEEPVHENVDLSGHWEVYSAQRDGKETSLLNGAVFVFDEEQKMQTNVTGQETSGSYVLENGTIQFTGGNGMDLDIKQVQGDTMLLATELQGMQFLFRMSRSTTERD